MKAKIPRAEQMKMFLTRIGFDSKAVITGDITQVDLPRGVRSGLRHAMEVLDGVDEISFNHFKAQDIVRHPVVARIVEAYERNDESERLMRLEKQKAREQLAAQQPPATKE